MTRALALLLSASVPTVTLAAPPDVQTSAPVIYLADNLDEPEQLGFCIDTLGRGLSDQLQLHSCKPAGGDVQFTFDPATGHVESHESPGLCMEVTEVSTTAAFLLVDCAEKDTQSFTVQEATIRPTIDLTLCVAGGPSTRAAGPFVSRDLVIAACASTDPTLLTWVIVD